LKKTAAVVVVALAAATSGPRSGLDIAALDRSVRPQDDLFRYANGTWLTTVEIPADRVSFGAFAALSDKTEADLKTIIDDVLARPSRAPGSSRQQIADLYLSAIDEERIERLGAAPLAPELARIDAITSAEALAAEAGHLSSIGAGGPFAGSVGADPSQAGVALVRIQPGGTLLPGRDYYVGASPPFAEARQKYQAYLRHIFELTSRDGPADAARDVLALEIAIAGAQWDDASAASPDERFTLRQLAAEMPGFDWAAWARPQGIEHAPAVILVRPPFFKAFAVLVPRVPLRTWRNWLVARYVTAAAPFLSRPFDDARFEFFGTALTGQELPRTRWKRGVSLVGAYLGDAIGRLYIERHFSPTSRARARRLVASLFDAYREALRDATWMTPASKRAAQSRLAAMAMGVGYPDEWRDYSALVIRRDDLFGNWQRVLAFENGDRVRRTGTPTLGVWPQPPFLVNALYVPSVNAIVVPAAILQAPVFNVNADDAVNYGAAGALIGHEISHAFDEMLADFDAGPLLAQLAAAEPLPGARVSAAATARETLGDIAGLSVAFRAYKDSRKGRPAPVIDGLTSEQRFFLGWAQAWRTKERAEYVRSTLATSEHLPASLRANLAATNIDGFYEAFGVRPGDALYRPPASRVRVW
jgi:predicted metalloendopeptidase